MVRRETFPEDFFSSHCLVPFLVLQLSDKRKNRSDLLINRNNIFMRRRVGTSLYTGLIFSVLGVIAWGSGQPFIFPSLGPTAFVLAFNRQSDRTQSYRVIGSHLIGGLAGLSAWVVVATGASITVTSPLSVDGFRLAASATTSVMLTSWAMIATDTVHPPACATTLIVSLGLLSTPLRVSIIVGSVITLVLFHTIVLRISGQFIDDSHSLDDES
jgi:CBS-domain-containing membrane protein